MPKLDTTKNPKIERVKYKLSDWGAWERSGNSLKFLGVKSQLGAIIDENTGGLMHHSLGLDDSECEKTHFIYLRLREFNIKAAECIHSFYVKAKSVAEGSNELGVNRDTFAKRIGVGEAFFAGQYWL